MGFLNAPLLWGLAAISLPILIHLLNRRRFNVVRWAAMDFLLEAQRENRRRVRLEHLLVLFLRCLALALLALLLARPAVSERGLGFLPGVSEPIERIVILDDSGSMAYRSGRGTSFDRARRLTERLVNDLTSQRPRDYLTVLRASKPEAAELRLATPTGDDAERFLSRLKEAEPGSGTLDLPRVLESALGTEPSKAPGKAVLYVITDLRHRDWIGETGELPKRIAAAIRESGRAGEGALRVLVVDVGGQGTRNLGVVGLEPVEKLAMAGLPFEVAVTVKNYGSEPVYEVPVTLETRDGRIPLAPLASIEPGGVASVRHRTTFLEPGAQALSVSVGEDALPLDDSRHLALEVTEQLRALLIDGEREEGPLGSEAALLRLALAPPGDLLSGVEPSVVLAEDAAAEELAGYDLVILCNVARWPVERQEELERFVRRGGGLAIFLGDKVEREAYERVLWREGQGLLPVQLGDPLEAQQEDQRPSLAPPADDHPLVKVFRGERNPFLTRVRASRWLSISSEGEPILRLTDPARTPYLVEKTFGKGRVVLFNTTADNAWSNLPKNVGWPVVVQELARLLAPSATRGRQLRCGEPLVRPFDQARDRRRAQVRVPGEERLRDLYASQPPSADEPGGDERGAAAPEEADEGRLELRLRDTSQAGVYELRMTSLRGDPRSELFAVNVDPSEGDLTRALPKQVQSGLEGIVIQFTSAGEEISLLSVTDGTRTELWRTLLYALVAVLLLEQVAAWWAAHHRPPLARLGSAA